MIGQFRLYLCKGMSGTHLSQSGDTNVLKKTGYEPSGGQIVKSQKISVFIMLFCWINSSNGTSRGRQNCTQTLILCKSLQIRSLISPYAIIER